MNNLDFLREQLGINFIVQDPPVKPTTVLTLALNDARLTLSERTLQLPVIPTFNWWSLMFPDAIASKGKTWLRRIPESNPSVKPLLELSQLLIALASPRLDVTYFETNIRDTTHVWATFSSSTQGSLFRIGISSAPINERLTWSFDSVN